MSAWQILSQPCHKQYGSGTFPALYMMIMMMIMMMMTMMMMVLTSSDPFHGPPFEGSKGGGSREHQPNGITFDHGNVYNINLFFLCFLWCYVNPLVTYR